MKITPLEIRQKTFEKAFRGLDKDEVDAFLTTLATEWEKLMDENKEYKIKLESSEKEVEKLREVENSLFKTLKTAEDTGANMIDQATKTADLHMRETEMRAEALMNEAKNKAKDMIEQAEMKSRNAIDDMEDRVKSLANLYKQLENVKDDLFSDIKSFANEAIDKANRAKDQVKKVNIDEELMKVKRDISPAKVSKKAELELNLEVIEPIQEIREETEIKNDVSAESVSNAGKSTSFFDDLD